MAPPGSGKTIVGLKLIRRFGEPAVAFAPTATIQQRWCEPGRPVPINVFTYQLISAPVESGELLKETARKM